jgi:DNA-binding SARP family transcriptional activator/DNA-binding CsgD family transcriptional regulator
MEFRLLGPLEVVDGTSALPIAARKQRALLAVLLLNANKTVARERIVDDLWGDAVPESARKMVQIYVSQLRKVLPERRLHTRPPGYELEVNGDELDLGRFERLVAEGRAALAAGRPAEASDLLRQALALWRGPALAEFSEPFAQHEGARLEELRITALEWRIEADLAAGHHADVVGELEALVTRHPLRERLRSQHMLALYRGGRHAEALASYQALRRVLADELGIEPSSALKELERRMLRQDPDLEQPAAPAVSVVRPVRRAPSDVGTARPHVRDGEHRGKSVARVPASRLAAQLVGREAELASLQGFLGADSPRALVLTGGPGIGKTSLWEAGVDAARELRLHVLSARPSDAEARHSFAALIDLLDGVETDELISLPAPQLQALEVALLRAVPAGPAPEGPAIAVGFLSALRALAAREPLLVAVDDIQWLDRPSADALAFAARRLEGVGVRFLLATRPGSPNPLEQALERSGLDRLEIPPLSVGALRRVLSERLGLHLPRQLLRRIADTTLGNPLFALEVGRTLAERGPLEIGEELPLPDSVEELLGTRVARLPASVRRLLLAVALTAELRLSQVAAIEDAGALDGAVDAGVLVVEGDRVRPSHPLLAAAAKKRSRAGDRRELHIALADTAVDEELRALHLALATELPDRRLATRVAAAARGASARGAAAEAVMLAEHALRLTTPGSAERSERLLELGGYLVVAGEKQRVTDLLSPELESLPSAAARARACVILADGVVKSNDDIQRYFERALAESGSDAELRASVLAQMTENTAVIRVERIREAEAWALEALAAARGAGPKAERSALYVLGWARSLQGRPIDDVCERFRAASDAAFYITESPERVAGQRLVWRGEVDRARAVLTRLLSLADERGEPYSYALVRLHVCLLELRIGECEAAARLLDEWAESSERELLVWPMYERCRALLAASRGFADAAEQWAAETLGRAEAAGTRWDRLEALRARGVAALVAHKPAQAAESLRAVWEHMEREGVDDPGVFPVAPDLVEALAELGELDEARMVTDRLRGLAEQQEHPWGLASAKRCGALVRLCSGRYDEEAATELTEAAGTYATLGLSFDRARSLLSLGRAQRRVKKWGAARDSLERAAADFDELGCLGWAEEARSELARVGARRASPPGKLTPTERRVAELAAEGLANKEIARVLVVTVNTVEFHLRHAYAKLGVRSRGQLAGRLVAGPQRSEDPRS